MAKKSTTKKTVIKKSSKKTSKPKVAAEKKKQTKTSRKTTSAASPVKTVKKAADKKKLIKTKKETKPKTVEKKIGQKTTMPRKKKTEEAKSVVNEVQSAAELRAKALEQIKGYSKEDLEHFRKIIMDKRDEIIEQLQNLKEQMLDPTTGEYINENSPYSLHMAEQGTDAMEREKTFLYAQRENKFLGYLEDALKRIDAGTYGICVECIEEPHNLCDTCPLIPKARLEAVPHSQLCLPMKQKQEKR